MCWAHISEDGLRSQPLSEHLMQTADLAGRFADVFHVGDWGYFCGLLHDIGKYSEKFQQRIQEKYKSGPFHRGSQGSKKYALHYLNHRRKDD